MARNGWIIGSTGSPGRPMGRLPEGDTAAQIPTGAGALSAARPPAPAATRKPMGPQSDGLTDSELVDQVVRGETDAFAGLVRRHGALVQRTVNRHVPRGRAEDLVQETFIRAFQSLVNFELGTKFPEWLTTIAVRTCYDYWRGHYRNRESPESSLTEQHRDWADRVTAAQSQERFDQEVRRQEAHEVLAYALDRLSPEDRLVVTLVHLEGLSVEEAARQLGWTAVNVKVRAHRSRRRMRQELEALFGKDQEGLWNAKNGTAKS
jgi:RNA polymerase sigma-70 factor (ECF subfamily)